MSNHLLAVLATVATLALVSCGGAPTTPDFVKKAAMSDLYEVEAGKIASEKGQSEAVKEFGRHMVEAHSKTSEELKAIVQAEKLNVELPTKLSKKRRKLIAALNNAKPEDFDRVYAKQQAKAHERAVELFDDYAEEGNNASLKQFAANVLPTIKQHREQAEKLLQ
jgi:putative membrane protein